MNICLLADQWRSGASVMGTGFFRLKIQQAGLPYTEVITRKYYDSVCFRNKECFSRRIYSGSLTDEKTEYNLYSFPV
ncbi:hypothetical protein DQZ83_22645 [Salmonella enterica subsp. enterica serovar Oranienburg]|nr:hypothetical protein [Salmonella enterica]EBQ9991669.1 hypothetical protein [Salmonella enterica subsp. enterica serovar Oranienburg]EBU9317638.1 hypothetical protein [Salmonella enterica subsp. enterica serovar Amager]EBU9822053.1 hypothetical protein [Salmonella enterica subsp. enterica serovar Newport]ECI3889959.1 hypothetical protein [Salmonella enterica subsp. enterica serovar Gombe]MKU04158.1 hypothetical protein [Salmonella enterica subsp. enterica serovar Kinondoni]